MPKTTKTRKRDVSACQDLDQPATKAPNTGEVGQPIVTIASNHYEKSNPPKKRPEYLVDETISETLTGLKCIPREIILRYLGLLSNRGANDPELPSVAWSLPTLLSEFNEAGYQNLHRKQRANCLGAFERDLWLIPKWQRHRWCLFVIQMKQRIVSYYDFLGLPDDVAMSDLLALLTNIENDRGMNMTQPLPWSLWNYAVVYPEGQVKKITHESGLFLCITAEGVTRNIRPQLAKANTTQWRSRILWALMYNKIGSKVEEQCEMCRATAAREEMWRMEIRHYSDTKGKGPKNRKQGRKLGAHSIPQSLPPPTPSSRRHHDFDQEIRVTRPDQKAQEREQSPFTEKRLDILAQASTAIVSKDPLLSALQTPPYSNNFSNLMFDLEAGECEISSTEAELFEMS